MASHKPQFIIIKSISDARKEIQKIGSDPKSLNIMAPKAVFKIIKLEQVVLQDAIIIKQDAEKSSYDSHHGDGDPTQRAC
jgi:hypothetical protein